MNSKTSYLFGLHTIYTILKHQPERIISLSLLKSREDEKIALIETLAKQAEIPVSFLARDKLDQLVEGANHQGVIAVCVKATPYRENDLSKLIENLSTPPFILILDGVQDPHNLGACFRSADAAGVHFIIAPKDNSASLTPTVSKVASGAAEVLPFVQVTNLVRAMKILKEQGIWIYGAAHDTEKTIYQTNLKGPLALVMGAEGTGLRRLTKDHCDGLAKIPMLGSVESLNVSVATGIFLFEAVRQRDNC